jgi:hypothetical protein
MRKVLLLLLLTLLVSLAHAQDDTLPREIASVAAAHRVDGAGLSVFVQAVDAPAPELSFNAAVPRSPASVIKLLTTFAALEVLGPAWRWRTEVWTTGEMDGERLTGDLIFKGGGDPALSMEKLWTLLRELRSRGIGRVEGDLVIDNTLFAPDPGDPNGFDGQPYRTYNVQPDALLVNHKAVGFRVRNGANGEVEATLDPPLSGFTVENRLRRARGRCGGFQRGVAFDLPGGPAGTQAVLSGSFPSGCSEYTLWRTVLDGPRFADAAIRPLWREIGGSIDGGLRVEPVPPEARRVLVFESIPLGEVVQQINKWSNPRAGAPGAAGDTGKGAPGAAGMAAIAWAGVSGTVPRQRLRPVAPHAYFRRQPRAAVAARVVSPVHGGVRLVPALVRHGRDAAQPLSGRHGRPPAPENRQPGRRLLGRRHRVHAVGQALCRGGHAQCAGGPSRAGTCHAGRGDSLAVQTLSPIPPSRLSG